VHDREVLIPLDDCGTKPDKPIDLGSRVVALDVEVDPRRRPLPESLDLEI